MNIKRILLIAILLWTVTIVAFGMFYYSYELSTTFNYALTEAKATYNQELLYRRWASGHGGVYVQIDHNNQVDPYLSHIPERDIITPSGKRLTLISPEYMARQVYQLATAMNGIRGHLISLNPLNQYNQSDDWEKLALKSFEKGENEKASLEYISGTPYLRYIKPMIVELSCLKCHGHQGYKVGDIRGGISVSVPWEPFKKMAQSNIRNIFIGLAFIWTLGFIGMLFYRRKQIYYYNARNSAQQALAESEADLSEAQRLAHIGSWHWTIETNNTRWSEELYNINGHDPKLPVLTFEMMSSYYTPESWTRLNEAVGSTLKTGEPYELELEMVRPDGSKIITLTRGAPGYDTNGKLISLHGTVQDITDRKQTEQALKENIQILSLFIKNSPIYSFIKEVTPIESRVLMASENYLDMIGIPGSAMVGKTMHELYPAEFAEKFTADDWEVVSSGQVLKLDEDMNGRNYISIKFPILLDGRNLLAGFTIDITDSKKVEAAIQMQNIELAELNASKDKFFSIIAHDLRSPLSGFLGLSRLMAENISEFTTEELQEISKNMQSSAGNLYQLLDNLLEWSRIQRGVTEYNPQKCDIAFMAKEIIDLLSDFAIQKEIKLVNNLISQTEVIADVPMLSTVLRNIISNAIKFTNRGGEVEIGTVKLSDDLKSSDNCFYVKDNGIGMNADTLNKLFKLDSIKSHKGTEGEPSTGLGLLLCKEFIEKHGGRIWVESEEGKGSTFRFTIPKP